MRFRAKFVLVFALSVVSGWAIPFQAKAARCDRYSTDVIAQMKSLGIGVACVPVNSEIKKHWLQFPTEFLTYPFPDGVVVWQPQTGSIQFSAAKAGADQTICALETSVVSEIPKPGKYLKHGWMNVTDQSAEYRCILKRQPMGKGKTSLHIDVYFLTIPKKNLDEARGKILCQTPEQLEEKKRRWW